jgi:hypothetical protein
LKAVQIWWELAPHNFLVDCFADLAGTGSTLFSGGLFLRQLRFGGNWLNIIFRRIVLDSAQIRQELAPHYFPADCFADLAGTGSTLFSRGLFLRQLRFGGNWLHIVFRRIVHRQLRFGGKWLHIIFWRIVSKAAQIWWELAPHYFPADCFGPRGIRSVFFCGKCQYIFLTHTAHGLDKLFSNCAVVSVSGLCGRLGFVKHTVQAPLGARAYP